MNVRVPTTTLLAVASEPIASPLLRVTGLSVAYGGRPTVTDVSLEVRRGEVVAIVGESGSGKTTTAQAIIGLLPASGEVVGGRIEFDGRDLLAASERELDALRGRRIGLVPQDPGSSLDPVRTIGAQLVDALALDAAGNRSALRARAIALLERVGLSSPELRFGQYPHELSGGMKQRVLIAIAVARGPDLILADEPTSALDVTVQKRVLDLVDDLRRERGTAMLLVTHDIAVAAERADRIVVMQRGRILEEGATETLLRAPQSAYTRQLIADSPLTAPSATRRPVPRERDVAIRVEKLVQEYDTPGGGRMRALDDLSLEIARGTTHALVGESGSGKSTTVRAIMGLARPTAGRVLVDGVDVTTLSSERLRLFRRRIQLVYQNPFLSLDPRQSVRAIVEEPLLNYERSTRSERAKRVETALARVAIEPALHERRPAALSGGQRQRVAIARALVLEPEILVLDEAVSALDVTVQAQILRLLDEMQRDLGLTYLFVSHDLSVVRRIADTVSVLQGGVAVESGPVARVFDDPSHPYTRALIDAIPGRGTPRPARKSHGEANS